MEYFYLEEKIGWDRHAEFLAEANKYAQICLLKQSLKENTGQRHTTPISVKRKLKLRLRAFFS